MNRTITAWALTLAVVGGLLSGCATNDPIDVESGPPAEILAHANDAYDHGAYVTAYRNAIQLANRTREPEHYLAAYIAGMSLWKLDDRSRAVYYLSIAKNSPDSGLAADALAALGLIHAEMGKHEQAVKELLAAAPKLAGDDCANAYLFAAISQQKLGQQAAARSNLLIAQRYAADPAIRSQINQLLGVTGYTLQTGAYTKEANARQAAGRLLTQSSSLNLGSPRILVITKDGKRYYRVQLGQFATVDSANRGRNTLRSAANVEAIIVPLGG